MWKIIKSNINVLEFYRFMGHVPVTFVAFVIVCCVCCAKERRWTLKRKRFYFIEWHYVLNWRREPVSIRKNPNCYVFFFFCICVVKLVSIKMYEYMLYWKRSKYMYCIVLLSLLLLLSKKQRKKKKENNNNNNKLNFKRNAMILIRDLKADRFNVLANWPLKT